MPLFDLTNKVFFITGGAQGIGKGYAKALLERGSKIFFGDINEEIGIATARQFSHTYGAQNVKFEPLNVCNKNQFEYVFKKAVNSFGQIDVMVNNAGIMDESKRWQMVDTNFIGTLIGTEIAYHHMRTDEGGKGGRIINTAPAAGLGNNLHLPVYCGLANAVRAFTCSMAEQPTCAARDIELGVISTSHAATEIVSTLNPDKVHFMSSIKEKLARETLGVERVVDAFLDLVTQESMNGAILYVCRDRKVFIDMQTVEIGESYPPLNHLDKHSESM